MLYRCLQGLFLILFKVVFRLRVIGRDNVPSDGAVILCANHISNMDPPIVGTPLPRKVYYMAKEELFRVPILGWAIQQLGAFPVKRGGVSRDSLRRAVDLLKSGNVLGIFPEGSRSNAGGMGKKGAASLALRAGAKVIPVAIVGRYKLFRRMTVIYGREVDLSEFAASTADDQQQATDKIMDAIRSLMRTYAI